MLLLLKWNVFFKEKRERLHRAIRFGLRSQVEEMLQNRDNECVMLAMAKNKRSRCSLHIAVLSQNEEIVRFLAEYFPSTLDVLDNVRQMFFNHIDYSGNYMFCDQSIYLRPINFLIDNIWIFPWTINQRFICNYGAKAEKMHCLCHLVYWPFENRLD